MLLAVSFAPLCGLLLTPPPTTPAPVPVSRRAALSSAAVALVTAAAPLPALARPEGVNKPELLPKGPVVNVIQMQEQRFLTTGQVTAVEKQIAKLQADKGIKLRVLCQQYPNTPGLAIKDYWNLDDNSIVMVIDKGTKGTANMLNFNVPEGVKFQLPNVFWTRLQNTFGNTFFVRENGEDIAIRRAIDTIDYCLRDGDGEDNGEGLGCVDVPLQFKEEAAAS